MNASQRRWRITAGSILALALAGGLPVTAAPAQSALKSSHGFRASLARFVFPAQLQRTTDRTVLRRSLDPSVGAVQHSEQLQLPAAGFPPGFQAQESQVQTVDDLNQTVFVQFHVRAYNSLGALGGWWQYYATPLSDGVFDIVYLGTYYPTPDAAKASFADVRGNLSKAGGGSCTFGDQCFQIPATIVFGDGTYRGQVRIVQSSNALAEMIADVPDADYTAQQGTIGTYLDGVTAAFLSIATPTPTVTPRPTLVSSPTPTLIPSPTASATATATATVTAIPTDTTVPETSGLKVKVSGTPRAGRTGTVQVTVHRSDDHRTVAGAQVEVDARAVGISATRQATTNRKGRAVFGGLNPRHSGRITIRVSKSGFTTRTVHVTVSS